VTEEDALNTADRPPRKGKSADRGKLKIGDDWNAIRTRGLEALKQIEVVAEFDDR
jgi:hypothetical protein